MPGIELFDFQQKVVDKLLHAAVSYYQNGPDIIGGRTVPFVGQLKAVTGAGKTPILADVVGRLKPSIVLWTTKYGSVVDQSVVPLRGLAPSRLRAWKYAYSQDRGTQPGRAAA